MNDENLRIVRFDIWCDKCQYKDLAENEAPCDECLENPVNDGTEKPVKYEERDK